MERADKSDVSCLIKHLPQSNRKSAQPDEAWIFIGSSLDLHRIFVGAPLKLQPNLLNFWCENRKNRKQCGIDESSTQTKFLDIIGVGSFDFYWWTIIEHKHRKIAFFLQSAPVWASLDQFTLVDFQWSRFFVLLKFLLLMKRPLYAYLWIQVFGRKSFWWLLRGGGQHMRLKFEPWNCETK